MIRRNLITLLSLICLSAFSTSAYKGKCGDNLTWELDKAGNLTISGTGDMKNYSADDTPWRPGYVKTLQIEDGVKSIGKNAFAKTKIATVVLPAGLESIGANAFKGCSTLASITLPYGLTTIDNNAFADCSVLPKILIPGSVRMIGEGAFSGCSRLTEVSVPARIKAIGKKAFKGCKNVTRILELPDFITQTNASEYGLPWKVVQSYYSNATAVAENSKIQSSLPTSQLSQGKPENKKAAGLAYGESDVDAPMQARPQNNTNTFAFVIANEHYTRMSDVPYALNDGTSFVNYCTSILGLPDSNVNFVKDATSGAMKGTISYIKDIDDAFNGDIDVIVYYAGHGSPSDDTKEAYLVPVDAAKVDNSYCYPLDKLYADLSDLKANSVTVFLDACFSGASRDNNMVEEARKVAVVPKKANLNGNLVVMSAASDEQTAWQYDSQGHGLFTYYLLKKLRESGGDITLGELSEYISSNVLQTSVVVNRKRQNPSVAASPTVGQRWRTWTLKK